MRLALLASMLVLVTGCVTTSPAEGQDVKFKTTNKSETTKIIISEYNAVKVDGRYTIEFERLDEDSASTLLLKVSEKEHSDLYMFYGKRKTIRFGRYSLRLLSPIKNNKNKTFEFVLRQIPNQLILKKGKPAQLRNITVTFLEWGFDTPGDKDFIKSYDDLIEYGADVPKCGVGDKREDKSGFAFRVKINGKEKELHIYDGEKESFEGWTFIPVVPLSLDEDVMGIIVEKGTVTKVIKPATLPMNQWTSFPTGAWTSVEGSDVSLNLAKLTVDDKWEGDTTTMYFRLALQSRKGSSPVKDYIAKQTENLWNKQTLGVEGLKLKLYVEKGYKKPMVCITK